MKPPVRSHVRTQSALQNFIDNITHKYLESHPYFIDVAIEKDASLKGEGKTRDIVKQELHFYPGVIAVAVHEYAHRQLKQGGVSNIVQARELSEAAHARTGIDIHPGTIIGENLFIDHGTGDVIGETARIGNNTQIMHKVTLGAYVNPKETRREILAHRHPEIGNDCFIGPGVEILGHVVVGDAVNILTKATLTGNNIKVGNNVRIGTGANIEDNCQIADGIKIGEGAFIHDGSGTISENIPSHAKVFRDDEGNLHIVNGLSELRKKATSEPRQELGIGMRMGA